MTAERVDTEENYGEDKRLTILLVIRLLSLHPKPILYTLFALLLVLCKARFSCCTAGSTSRLAKEPLGDSKPEEGPDTDISFFCWFSVIISVILVKMPFFSSGRTYVLHCHLLYFVCSFSNTYNQIFLSPN